MEQLGQPSHVPFEAYCQARKSSAGCLYASCLSLSKSIDSAMLCGDVGGEQEHGSFWPGSGELHDPWTAW